TVSTTEHVSTSAARSDEPRASAVEAPPVGIEAETSLSAFPAESPQPAASPRIKREPVRSPARSSVHPVVAAVGFVLMMSIGAGAAALVFHDRVTLIVAQWHIASR